MKNIPEFDKTTFRTTPFFLRVEKPWGYELILTPSNLPYTGKILHINAGKQLSLQIHDTKKETFFLHNGSCNLKVENAKGELETVLMEKDKGYTILPGQRHRHLAVTDCDIIEVSTPEIGTTYRLEDDYGRLDETEEKRINERNNIQQI